MTSSQQATVGGSGRCPLPTVGDLIDFAAVHTVPIDGKSIGWTQAEAETTMQELAERSLRDVGIAPPIVSLDTPLPAGGA